MKTTHHIPILITVACLAVPFLSAEETDPKPKQDPPGGSTSPREAEAQNRPTETPSSRPHRAIQRKRIIQIPHSEPPKLVAGSHPLLLRSLANSRWMLGVNVEALEPYVRAHLSIEPNTGLRVTQVMDDSAAWKAGIRVDDILIRVDGKPLPSLEALKAAVEQAGERRSSLEVEVLQSGEKKILHISPTDTRPAPPEDAAAPHLRDRPIQQLTRRINRQQREIEALRKEIADLRKKLESDEQE